MLLKQFIPLTQRLNRQAGKRNPKVVFRLGDDELDLSNISYFQKEDKVSLRFTKKINIKKEKEKRDESNSQS
jgi:hypothetical protein